MKEAISNRNEDVVEKEKVMFPEIVVRGTDDKPYYEIKYYDVTDKQWHLGYGSYNLDYVKQWKEECGDTYNFCPNCGARMNGGTQNSYRNRIIDEFAQKAIERLEDMGCEAWRRDIMAIAEEIKGGAE